MTNIATMTADEIRKRLGEITVADRTFAARDLDAEMSAVMRAGGDVDEMEAKILDAERLARRLRAERAALEGELPEAVKREGFDSLALLAKRHDEIAVELVPVIANITETWAAFKAAVQGWHGLQIEAMAMTEQAETVARTSGATMPSLGNFRSKEVAEIVREINWDETWQPLNSGADFKMSVGPFQVQSRSLD